MAALLFGRSLGHFTLREYTRNLGPALLLSPSLFAVIREPEDRFLSAYRFFCQGRTCDAGVQLAHPRANLWKQDIDLFLQEYIEATQDCVRDYIFQTQYRFVSLAPTCHVGLKLFRLDDMAALEAWLAKRLHKDIIFPYKNRSDRSHSVKLSVSQRACIRRVYKQDFDLYEHLQNHSYHS